MFSSWRVGVIFTAVNQTGAAFSQLAASAAFAHGQMQKLMATMSFFSGIQQAAGAAAQAIIGFGEAGLKAAADYQMGMVKLGLATGSYGVTPQWMAGVQANIWRQYSRLAQSPAEVQEEYIKASQAGFTAKMLADDRFMTTMLQFADIQKLVYQSDVGTTMTQLSQLAHLFQAYDPTSMLRLAEYANRIQMMANPEDFSRLLQQGKYFVGFSKTNMGLTDQDEFELLASAAQTGFLRARGGTGILRMLQAAMGAISYTSLVSNRPQALRNLGILDAQGKPIFWRPPGWSGQGVEREYYSTWHLDLNAFLDHLAHLQELFQKKGLGKEQASYATDMMVGLGQTAGQVSGVMTSPLARRQALITLEKIRSGKTIEEQQQELIHTLTGSLLSLSAGFEALKTSLFLGAAQPLANIIGDLAQKLDTIAIFFKAHPELARWVPFTMLVTVLALLGIQVVSTVGIIQAALDVLRAQTGMGLGGVAGSSLGFFGKGLTTLMRGSPAAKWALGPTGLFGAGSWAAIGPWAIIIAALLVIGYEIINLHNWLKSGGLAQANAVYEAGVAAKKNRIATEDWARSHPGITWWRNMKGGLETAFEGLPMTPAEKAAYDKQLAAINAHLKSAKSLDDVAKWLAAHPIKLVIDGKTISQAVHAYDSRNGRYIAGTGSPGGPLPPDWKNYYPSDEQYLKGSVTQWTK